MKNRKEILKKTIEAFPQSGLDKDIAEEFGIVSRTIWSVFQQSFVTLYPEVSKNKKREIDIFIKAYMKGNEELKERIENIMEL